MFFKGPHPLDAERFLPATDSSELAARVLNIMQNPFDKRYPMDTVLKSGYPFEIPTGRATIDLPEAFKEHREVVASHVGGMVIDQSRLGEGSDFEMYSLEALQEQLDKSSRSGVRRYANDPVPMTDFLGKSYDQLRELPSNAEVTVTVTETMTPLIEQLCERLRLPPAKVLALSGEIGGRVLRDKVHGFTKESERPTVGLSAYSLAAVS